MFLFQLKDRLIGMISGLPRGQRVYRTMESIFDTELILLFSWAGRKCRYGFESTFVERVVTDALCCSNFFGSTLKAQGAIKNHFKNLRGRLLRKSIRESPAAKKALDQEEDHVTGTYSSSDDEVVSPTKRRKVSTWCTIK